MKKKLPLILLSMLIGGCVANAAPVFADAASVAEATIMILVRDMETGANRTLVCAPVNIPAIEPTYH